MFRSLILFLLILVCNVIFAKNFGIFGAVYPIVEEDLHDFIYRRLNEMQQNGALAKMQQAFTKNVTEHTLRPTPVENLTTTEDPKFFYYDPTLILKNNIENASGQILFPKGTRINPLEKITLHSVLFFLDGDDKHQITWTLEQSKKYKYVKYILVRGNIKESANGLKNRVYFDQHGDLVRKLGIEHVPCIVRQEGQRLAIQEIKLKN